MSAYKDVEKVLKSTFRDKFKVHTDGSEYFEGDPTTMIKLITQIVHTSWSDVTLTERDCDSERSAKDSQLLKSLVGENEYLQMEGYGDDFKIENLEDTLNSTVQLLRLYTKKHTLEIALREACENTQRQVATHLCEVTSEIRKVEKQNTHREKQLKQWEKDSFQHILDRERDAELQAELLRLKLAARLLSETE